MFISRPASTWPWPPEVPPHRPPGPPGEPAPPPPEPILPSWEEPLSTSLHRDVTDRLLDQRVIILGGRLDDAAANRVASQLVLLGSHDASPIELHFTCSEADLNPSIALADAVDLVDAPVHATVRGSLRGPAVAVLCAAAQRTAHRHAAIVLSLPTASAEGTAGELAAFAEEHERQVGRLRDRIASTTDRAAPEVEQDLRSGRVLSAQEALDYGLLNRLL